MNRGSAISGDWLRVFGTAFNEAPIHESGKWSRLERECGGLVCLQ